LNSEELQLLFLKKTRLIDVRAPVEFAHGHLPYSINLPILNDEERTLVGTVYKKDGNEAAIKLGYNLVSGEVKSERVQKWLQFITEYPETVIYCFRGGLRSQITQKWIQEAGVFRPLIDGGFKRARHFLIEEVQKFSNVSPLIVLSGTTGSGKTTFLNEVKSYYPVLDLEALACHRGSAFGAMNSPQPSQINFENELAISLMRIKTSDFKNSPLLVEDESQLVGNRAVPKSFFDKMRASPVLWIEETLESRINNIFQDYVVQAMIDKKQALDIFVRYKNSLEKISKKLGGLRTQELRRLLIKSESDFLNSNDLNSNKEWIEKLLVYYYDPMYLGSLERRNPKILFKGNRDDCANFLRQLKSDKIGH
jgi:tRNA 2-selenouridine synthase